jgi:hypothetical protein
MLNEALFIFTREASPIALERGPRLLAVDPLLARPYGFYLRELAAASLLPNVSDHVEQVVAAFRGYLPPWSWAWLTEVYLEQSAPLSEPVASRMREFLVSTAPSTMRVRCALALAVQNQITPGELGRLFDTLAPVARADIAASFAVVDGRYGKESAESRAAVSGDPLYQWIYTFTRESYPDLSWL